MRNLLLGVLLLPAIAIAEPVTVEKPVLCDKIENVLAEISKKHGEQPIWYGDTKDSKVAIFVNPEKGSWSVIQFNENLGCVLEVGEGFYLNTKVFGGKSI